MHDSPGLCAELPTFDAKGGAPVNASVVTGGGVETLPLPAGEPLLVLLPLLPLPPAGAPLLAPAGVPLLPAPSSGAPPPPLLLPVAPGSNTDAGAPDETLPPPS